MNSYFLKFISKGDGFWSAKLAFVKKVTTFFLRRENEKYPVQGIFRKNSKSPVPVLFGSAPEKKNVVLRSTKVMYICGKCFFTAYMKMIFPISMQKTVRAQIGPVKKNSQFWGEDFCSFLVFVKGKSYIGKECKAWTSSRSIMIFFVCRGEMSSSFVWLYPPTTFPCSKCRIC